MSIQPETKAVANKEDTTYNKRCTPPIVSCRFSQSFPSENLPNSLRIHTVGVQTSKLMRLLYQLGEFYVESWKFGRHVRTRASPSRSAYVLEYSQFNPILRADVYAFPGLNRCNSNCVLFVESVCICVVLCALVVIVCLPSCVLVCSWVCDATLPPHTLGPNGGRGNQLLSYTPYRA